MLGYARPLIKDEEIHDFVSNVLEIHEDYEIFSAVRDIQVSETLIKFNSKHSTQNSLSNCDIRYNTNEKREKLREQIIEELFGEERLLDDNKTQLGLGGAKPRGNEPLKEHKLYLIIGLPASGKSGIANKIADFTKSYMVDSDLVKRKLPEFTKMGGASLVHDESVNVANDFRAECIKEGYNIVIPKIGASYEVIKDLADIFSSENYKVYLILVELDRKLAVQRAYKRFVSEKRYVPLSVIYDAYANEPTLTYYRMKQKSLKLLSGSLHLDNDVSINSPPKIIENNNMTNLIHLFKRKEALV